MSNDRGPGDVDRSAVEAEVQCILAPVQVNDQWLCCKEYSNRRNVIRSLCNKNKFFAVGPSYKLQRADTSNETVALPDTYVINCHSRMILKVRQRVLKDVTHVRWDKPLDRSRIFYSETLQKERLACSTPSAKM
ncbi:hypothetical protein ACM14_02230 [Delftia sp. JD2]|nr:hypothetical protein ACM14_02230 [Delftia sp. JD2]